MDGLTRDEMKAIVREAVKEELDARLLAANRKAIEDEMNHWKLRAEYGDLG